MNDDRILIFAEHTDCPVADHDSFATFPRLILPSPDRLTLGWKDVSDVELAVALIVFTTSLKKQRKMNEIVMYACILSQGIGSDR